MTQLEVATPDSFEQVYPVLSQFNNPRISRERWRSLFHYTWPVADPQRGFLLRDAGRVVGFFGTILSERDINGARQSFANLTSWVTLPEYRNASLQLFQAVVRMTGRTLTCATPKTATLPLYLRFGFRPLESKLVILLPKPSRRIGSIFSGDYSSSTEPDRIAKKMHPGDQEILAHHRPHPCGHLLIRRRNRDEYCYMVFTRTRGRRYPFVHIHHISNRALFAEALDLIKLRLCWAARAPLVMINSRLVTGLELPASRHVDLGYTQVFRSESLVPEQIDNLYTELPLLAL